MTVGGPAARGKAGRKETIDWRLDCWAMASQRLAGSWLAGVIRPLSSDDT